MILKLAEYRDVAHTWGTTAGERSLRFPCDEVLPDHTVAYFRGLTVGASPAALFGWLCQLRVAAYSYDWISHPGRRSPRRLDPALQALALGQSVMDVFDLAAFESDRHLTLRLRAPGFYPPLAVSYVIVPLAAARCRLLVKLVVRFQPTLGGRLSRALAPWLDWWMMRRQLLNLKALAEGTFRSGAARESLAAGAHVIGRSTSARAARAGALSSVLSARYLWAKLRGLPARRERRAAIMDDYHLRSAEQVVELMGNMKGLFMKLGQIVSFISDDVPEPYRTMLAQLQTTSPPMSFELARRVIESELSAPLHEVFREIDEEPMAAASIGQVHRARLRSGEDVAVKVQYPGVDEAIRADLTGMTLMNGLLGMMSPGLDVARVAAELRTRISEELDYGREASNQQAFAEIYEGHPFIRIPAVFPQHSAARVLTQRFAGGHGFEWLLAQPSVFQQRTAEILFRFVFGSIFRFHIFNADPHPGNYRFHEDGTVTFLDFGCVKHFPPEMVAAWMEIIRAHLRGDKLGFREQAVRLGFLRPDSDLSLDAYYECVGYFYAPFAHDQAFTFTPEYNAQSFRVMFDRSHPVYGEVQRKLNLPPDFVLVNRLQWGLNSILTQLRATANWHRILREYLHGDPPSTELGRQSASFRAAWRAARADPVRLMPGGEEGVA